MRSLYPAVALFAAACGGGHKTPATTGPDLPPATQPKLCVELTQDVGQPVPFDLEENDPGDLERLTDRYAIVPRVVVFAEAAYPLDDRGGEVVVATSCTGGEDSPPTCAAELLVVTATGDEVKIVRRIPIPTPAGTSIDDTSVQAYARVADTDHDGARELWLLVEVDGPPQPAVGVATTNWLVVYSLPQLELLLATEHGSSAQAEVSEVCHASLYTADLDCDGKPDLIQKQLCGPGKCLEEDDDAPEDQAADPMCADEREHKLAGWLRNPDNGVFTAIAK